MMTRFLLSLVCCGLPLVSAEEPTIIDEANLASSFEGDMDVQIKKGVPTGFELAQQALSVEGKTLKLNLKVAKKTSVFSYEADKNGVAVIASLFKCGKCQSWHRGGIATAWVISADGILVTNYHVVAGATDKSALGIWLPSGKTYPVVEILATDPLEDIAVIKVSGAEDLPVMPVARKAPPVGTPVSIISHPSNSYYMLTEGIISRYFKTAARMDTINNPIREMLESNVNHDGDKKPVVVKESEVAKADTRRQTWVNVSADFCKGSSGAPIFNEKGEVVAMVSSIRAIYNEGRFRPEAPDSSVPRNFQMSIRNCVPQQALKRILLSE